MKYSQKLQPGWVRFSRSVRISSSKRPRFLVKDMRRRVRSFSSKEFQDSWDRDESFRGSDRTTHLDEKTKVKGKFNSQGSLDLASTDYRNCFETTCERKQWITIISRFKSYLERTYTIDFQRMSLSSNIEHIYICFVHCKCRNNL